MKHFKPIPQKLAPFLFFSLFFIGLYYSSYSAQEARSEFVINTVETVLRIEGTARNPNQIARTLVDLQSLKIVSCVHFEQKEPFEEVFLNPTDGESCLGYPWLLLGVAKTSQVTSGLNGSQFSLSYVTINSESFYSAIIGMLLLGLISSLLLEKYLSSLNKYAEEKLELEKKQAVHVADISRQVSHDIKAPLSLLKVAVPQLTKISSNEKRLLGKATERIEKIVRDLDLKSVIVTKGDIPNRCNVEETLKFACDEFRTRYSAKNLEIIIKKDGLSDSISESQVCIEESTLARVLSNLLNNAAETLEMNGLVTVRHGFSSPNYFISISDNGCGMSKVVLEKIWQKGFSFGKRNGKGLGLYHAKKSVENVGGLITVKSTEEQGTTFEIKLPLV